MSVLKFGFPERVFYDNKGDSNTQTLAEEIGLVLASTPPFDYPTLRQVKSAAVQTSYVVEGEEIVEENGRKKWVCGLFKAGDLKTHVYVEADTDKVSCLEFERGDEQAILEFLHYLSQYCGSVVFYEDTGVAKLIKYVEV